MTIKATAFARAGLIGNPSDGYYGKTISIIVRNFSATVRIEESKLLEIVPSEQDAPRYENLSELLSSIRRIGYYGGERLMKAIIKLFAEYCQNNNIALRPENFSLSYSSNIPRCVGLGGSSALVTAAIRALCAFYGVSIPREVQPSIVLSAERDELGIGAGLQDRVIQTYEGMVYMDFSREIMDATGRGRYEPMDPALLPPLFIAYDTSLGEGSEVVHNDLRERFEHGDAEVVSAMKRFADLTDRAREELLAGRSEKLGPLMSENFDLRRSLCRLSKRNIRMIEVAREAGAHAKFAGSGGAAVGTYTDDEMFDRLSAAYRAEGYEILKPVVTA